MFSRLATGVDDLQLGTALLCCSQHGLQALMVAWCDDGSVVGVARNGREELGHSLGKGMTKSGFFTFGQQHIVRRNAGLASVQKLAVGDFDGGCVQVTARVNDAGRLTA